MVLDFKLKKLFSDSQAKISSLKSWRALSKLETDDRGLKLSDSVSVHRSWMISFSESDFHHLQKFKCFNFERCARFNMEIIDVLINNY